MYCYKCGTKNNSNSNFCYKCGTKVIKKQNKITYKPNNWNKYLDITGEINFLKEIAYNIVISKNKYINIFLCIATFVLSSTFFTSTCVRLPKSISLVTELVFRNPPISSDSFFIKEMLEQNFRDIWCQIILIFFTFVVIISSIVVFTNSIKLSKKLNPSQKNNQTDE
ncbi:MAG: hypothetical protein RUMPE_00821 [Eubacteriales bacterium SKADARSKE-1]|nr:hypothetical protein [Eubacteriales bacterium SKADARSKE-1]